MPRDGTKNLKPMNQRTKEEQKKIASAGGKASGKARRNRAMLKDCIIALMEQKVIDPNDPKGKKKITGAEQLSAKLYKQALEELDTAKAAKAFEVLRDTSGQKPVEKVMVAEVDQTVIDEVEAMLNDDED